MLKTLSLAPDEARDEATTEDGENSESRMLRALEAMSSNTQVLPEHQPQPPSGGFRPNKSIPRDIFRSEPMHHGTKPRHRFVKDGEVPVVHMSTPRARDAAPVAPRNDQDIVRLQHLLDEQTLRAEVAERARAEAANALKTMHTKLAHAELALTDAQNLAQSRLAEIHVLQETMRSMQPAPAPDPNAPVKRRPGRPRKYPLAVSYHPPAPPAASPSVAAAPASARDSRVADGGFGAAAVKDAATKNAAIKDPAIKGPAIKDGELVAKAATVAAPASPSPAAAAPAILADAPVKRGRGRPRKNGGAPPALKPAVQPAASAVPAGAPVAKRGPGRPRKVPLELAGSAPVAVAEPEPVAWWLLPAKGKRRG